MLREARQLLSAEETTDLTQLEQIWYEGNVSSSDHYNWTRYYALNLHSVFTGARWSGGASTPP